MCADNRKLPPEVSTQFPAQRLEPASMPRTSSSSSASSTSNLSSSSFDSLNSTAPAPTAPQPLDAAAVEQAFKRDGYTEVIQWQDGPSTQYDVHTHPTDNAYYMLRGDMLVTCPLDASPVRYGQGERFDIAASVPHFATMGPRGCVFMVGSRRPEREAR